MYPQGYPYAPMPQPPRKPGLSALAIALIVLAGALVVGGGACVVVGALLVGASDDSEHAAPSSGDPTGSSGADNGAGASAPAATVQAEDDHGGAGAPGHANAPSAPTPPPAPAAVTPVWFCSASGSVLVCGFANVCNHQMVFGQGSGPDRFLAQQSAKMACESMARAKGSSTICAVSCSVATKR